MASSSGLAPHESPLLQVDWRALRDEIDAAAAQMTRLQDRFAAAVQQSSTYEAHLRSRTQALEAERQAIQLQLENAQRENAELSRAVRQHATASEHEVQAQMHRLREDRRTLRHLARQMYEVSGRIVEASSPTDNPLASPSSPNRDARTGDSAGYGSQSPVAGPSQERRQSPHARAAPPHGTPLSMRLTAPNTPHSTAGRSPAQTAGDANPSVLSSTLVPSEDSYGPVDAVVRHNYAPQAAIMSTNNVRSSEPDSGERQAVRLRSRREAIRAALEANSPQVGHASSSRADPRQDSALSGWTWVFNAPPTEDGYGPINDAELIAKVPAVTEDIAEWSPQPTHRVRIFGDVALYWDPTFMVNTAVPRRVLLVNWGAPSAIQTEKAYIWNEGPRTCVYHTFMLVYPDPAQPEWWYVGKMQWTYKRRLSTWPSDIELKRRIADNMKEKWNVRLSRAEIMGLIDSEQIVQMSIELSSNDALAVESREFIETVLRQPTRDAVGAEN